MDKNIRSKLDTNNGGDVTNQQTDINETVSPSYKALFALSIIGLIIYGLTKK